MFKRVEKRLAKKKEEEELGITEEIKEAVGLNGLDSDDSTSDESEASSSSSTPQIPSKRKRPFEEEIDDGSDSAFGGRGSSASADEFDDEDEPDVQMTVEEVLHNPLFITSIQPDIRGCIVCPRKVLKNDTMVSVHTTSQVSPKVPPTHCGGLLTFSLAFGRPISDECPSSRKWLHLRNKMMTPGKFCPLLSHQLRCLKSRCPPMIPPHYQSVRSGG